MTFLYPDAEPLTKEEVSEFVEEHLIDDLVTIDGTFYCLSDTWKCVDCGLSFPCRGDLVEFFGEDICEDCLPSWEEQARYEEEKWADWRDWQ